MRQIRSHGIRAMVPMYTHQRSLRDRSQLSDPASTVNRRNEMPRLIIAVRDNVAQDVIGPIQLIKHEAQGVRYFSDIAVDPQTMVHRHVADYDLVQLGVLQDDLTIAPTSRIIITGAAWKAAQERTQQETEA